MTELQEGGSRGNIEITCIGEDGKWEVGRVNYISFIGTADAGWQLRVHLA